MFQCLVKYNDVIVRQRVCFYFALYFGRVASPQAALWIVTAFALAFPIWFFRYARSLWMGFDHYWDPTTDGPSGGQRGPNG